MPTCNKSISENENYQELSYELFPSPNDGNFKILFNKILESDITVQIYDQLGKLIQTHLLFTNENNLHEVILDNITDGIYYIKVLTSEKEFEIQKIVIEKF